MTTNGSKPEDPTEDRAQQLMSLAIDAAELMIGAEPESRIFIYLITPDNGAITMRGIPEDIPSFLNLALEAAQQAAGIYGMTVEMKPKEEAAA